MTINRILKEGGIDSDTIDLKAEHDSTLTVKENEQHIQDIIGHPLKQVTDGEYNSMVADAKLSYEINWKDILTLCSVIGIAGAPRTGKTSMGFFIAEHSDKPIYLFRYPKPELVPYNNIYKWGEMTRLKDSFIWIDEPHMFIDISDKRQLMSLLRFFSVMAQKDNTLVLSTSDTRWYQAAVESYITAWVVKGIDVEGIKRGSKIRKIALRNSPMDAEELDIRQDEYVFD